MLVELHEGFFVNPDEVTVVKTAGEDKCVLYVTGQSALDGFVVPYEAEEVAQQINEAFDDEDTDDEEAGADEEVEDDED